MNELLPLYHDHLELVSQRYEEILTLEQLDGVILHSGQLTRIFLDDQHYPFKVMPHFRQWLPDCIQPNCWLVIEPQRKPLLIYYQPVDFWHGKAPEPLAHWAEFFDITYLERPEQVASLLPEDLTHFAYVGAHPEVAEILGMVAAQINPESLLNYLHYHRAWKSEYEITCLERANALAVKGHLASRAAFYQGASEFEIHLEFLGAVGQRESEQPFDAIIALNEHCATLHYTGRCRRKHGNQDRSSMMIDAGATFNGYGADISRTYSYRKDYFADLILKMEHLQQMVVESIKVGTRFTQVQEYAQQQMAQLLHEEEFLFVAPEQILERGLERYFFPHGIGHHIGLQTHDAGGLMQDERGTILASPENAPFLRCTRIVDTNQVLTIEPGLYFIPALLEELKLLDRTVVNWDLVESLLGFGGIRVEDNILIQQNKTQNLTRSQNWQ